MAFSLSRIPTLTFSLTDNPFPLALEKISGSIPKPSSFTFSIIEAYFGLFPVNSCKILAVCKFRNLDFAK